MIDRKVLALGFFDGVHLGHQALLAACRDLAAKLGCPAGVLTFGTHPDRLVLGKDPGLINTVEDRECLLRHTFGMDEVITLPFDRALMEMPWWDFYRMLREQYGAAGIVCGEDFTFGYKGLGHAALLREACQADGISCIVVPQLKLGGLPVSSTRIRGLMEAGDVAQMNRLLGHAHMLTGLVVPGQQLGRTLGIPTANLPYPDSLHCLRRGVYACAVEFDGQRYAAVTNVGTRPTVGGKGVVVESWILNFTGDLYGKRLKLSFLAFLRPEKKFPDLQVLQEEIRKNGEEAAKIFEKM